MSDEADALVNRLFEVTERYECLLRTVQVHPSCDAILARAKQIERERGLLKGDEG